MQQISTKEYKAGQNCVGKVIHLELFKKLEFDYTKKWYMHNLESVQDNEMHIVCKFEIQTDHHISSRRPDLVIVNKKRKEENLLNSIYILLKNWKSYG